MQFKMLFAILLVLGYAFCIGEEVINIENSKDEIYLGKITQGQRFSIFLDPIADKGGIFEKGGRYDIATAEGLPKTWLFQPSSLYGNPLEVVITVPKDAKSEDISFYLLAVDEGNKEELGVKKIKANLKIVDDSMTASSKLSSAKAGVRNPVSAIINIKNNVDFGNLYEISIKSLDYSEKSTVYVGGNMNKRLEYSFNFEKEGLHDVEINVHEVLNPKKSYNALHKIEIDESLMSEYRSIGEGVLLVPVPQALPYYVAYLASFLFNY